MPSNRLPACAFCRSSGSTFQSPYLTCVTWLTFQLCLQTQPPTLAVDRILRRCPLANLRPSPPINLPALPADQPPTLIVCCIPMALPSGFPLRLASPSSPSGAACRATSTLPSAESLRRCPPGNRRLASPTNLPALPGEPNFNSVVAAFSGCAFRLTFDLRLRSTFQFRLPTSLWLAPPIDLPATFPSFPSACASCLTVRLRLQTSTEFCRGRSFL